MIQNPGTIKVRIDIYNCLIRFMIIIRDLAWQKNTWSKVQQVKWKKQRYWQKKIYGIDKKSVALTYRSPKKISTQEIKPTNK